MTPEQLLIPRRKVIIDYPESPYRIGDILELVTDTEEVWYNLRNGKKAYMALQQYPAIFKRLEWWEDRLPEDMPEYVKSHRGVYKVTSFNDISFEATTNNGELDIDYPWGNVYPATEQEYLNQTK